MPPLVGLRGIRKSYGSIEALREFWLAETELQASLTGRPSGAMGAAMQPAAGPAMPAAAH